MVYVSMGSVTAYGQRGNNQCRCTYKTVDNLKDPGGQCLKRMWDILIRVTARVK